MSSVRPGRAFAVLGLAAAAVLASCGTVAEAPSAPQATTTTVPTPAATLPPTTTPPVTQLPATSPPATTTTTAPPPATRVPPNLEYGDSGIAVLTLQRRLMALGYWLGTPDGTFGFTTQQAVYALQKVAGIGRDGVVGPETRKALDKGVVPPVRSRVGRVVEINLSLDILMIVDKGELEAALNTSTGGGYVYVDEGVTAVARTPTGRFSIFRQVDGLVVSSLGELWRPKFFNGGYAIHGSPSIPPYPASHGCVRLSNAAIDWIWAQDLMPVGTQVWIY